ncbi:hypothetical protein QTL95_17125 [Rhizobium sp. S152]|uniref:type IV toxin-antitoxin system AbiEi family antitoxin domain-containing protein n=1 Tax=Rhizobium sp. S152 TaxID=3055038 RepID=UPI0025A945DC|nr:hypothetical protein [Rhizobium sp. S152]MDM9627627.1 hypothetical protein [Rhizobium sp. S152]
MTIEKLQLSPEILYSVSDLSELGYSRTSVGRLVQAGALTSPLRGVYRPAGGDEAPLLDKLASMSKHCPNAVFFLFTAASFHGLATREPAFEHIGLPPTQRAAPTFSNGELPVDVVRWSRYEDWAVGVEIHHHLGVDIRITSPERTLFDLWRYSYRNPTLKGTHERVTDENLFDGFSGYFDKFSRNTGPLGDLAETLERRMTTRNAYGDFLLTFERGFNARQVF